MIDTAGYRQVGAGVQSGGKRGAETAGLTGDPKCRYDLRGGVRCLTVRRDQVHHAKCEGAAENEKSEIPCQHGAHSLCHARVHRQRPDGCDRRHEMPLSGTAARQVLRGFSTPQSARSGPRPATLRIAAAAKIIQHRRLQAL